jgi:hypothetical protein
MLVAAPVGIRGILGRGYRVTAIDALQMAKLAAAFCRCDILLLTNTVPRVDDIWLHLFMFNVSYSM